MSRQLTALATLLIAFATPAVCPAEHGFENMVRRVPSRANTLVLFNVEMIHNSPVAQREGWKEKHVESFKAGLVGLPPDTLRFVMAQQLDFDFMNPIWDVAVYHLDRHLTLPAIAQKLGGSVDHFGTTKTLVLPSGAHLVLFDNSTGATFLPGNRQMVGRWLEQAMPRSQPALSPYLSAALGYADIVGSPIIMAIDMRNAVSPIDIREALQKSAVIKSYNADIDKTTEILASIQGVTLGITLSGDAPFGRIKVDFGKDAIPLGGFAKPLLLEVLRKRGAMVDDFINWQGKIVGTQVSLSGILTEDGMNRIFSLVDAPKATMHSNAQEGAGDEQVDPKVQPSLTYFREVSSLIDDVRGKEAQTPGQAAIFFDKYARKIEQLPMLNVDNNLLDYGAYVASQLRQASGALCGAAISSRTRQVNLPNFTRTYVKGEVIGATRWRTHGAYSWATFEDRAAKQQARTQVRAQERLKGNAAVLQIFADLETLTAEARRAMTQQYQVQF